MSQLPVPEIQSQRSQAYWSNILLQIPNTITHKYNYYIIIFKKEIPPLIRHRFFSTQTNKQLSSV